MAEEVVITKDQFGRDVTIPIDEKGNIILYRATDDPNRIIDSDFRPLANDSGSVGLGQQSYFSPNPMYSHKYESSGRKNYKFITDIKPNQILATDFPVNNYPELVKVLNIPEEYTNQNWRQLVNNNKAMIAMGYEAGGKRFFNDNIQTFKDNGIKAFGSATTGTGGQPYIEYEIIPLVKEGDTLGIKPIATLQTKEGFDAGKSPEAFIETSLDTPTNVAGAEVIDEGVDITESSAGVVDEIEKIQQETVEKLRIANDSFVDQQLDDIMARKINEVLPFVDTSISRADAIGIAITGPEVLDSADPVLNSFIKEIEQLTGQSLQTSEKRKLRQFIYDMAIGKDNLLDDKKSFISGLRDGVDNSKLKDPGYKIWKNWQHSGAFIPENLLGRTVNEFKAFGPPSYVSLLEGLEKSGETINYKAISDTGLEVPDTPTNVVDDVSFNKSEAIDNVNNLVDELPLEDAFRKQVKRNTARIGKNAATPGGFFDFIDAWELGVLGLAAAAIATNEVDEIPTILYNQGIKMYNNMLSSVGLPVQVEEKPYNINFEKAIETLNLAEMLMPTAYAEKALVKEFKKGQEAGIDISAGLGAGAGVPPMQFKTEEPKEDTGNINSIMTNLMSNISNAQKSYPITADEIGTFGRNPINVVPEDTKDKPVKVEYDSKEKQNLHDIYANLYTKLSNASARIE